MPFYVAMLRGINVSGQKLIKMDRLRASFAALGFSEVQTYIQSGNVVFKARKMTPAGLAGKIAGKILAEFGFTVSVLVRTPEELKAILKHNPLLKFTDVAEDRLHVTFLSAAAPKTATDVLQAWAAKSERLSVGEREIYLHCPAGYGNTKLSNALIEKKLSVQATTRNWRTVNVLYAMTQAETIT